MQIKDAAGKTRPAHCLNGNSLALPKIAGALLENNQTGEGIMLPKVLRGGSCNKFHLNFGQRHTTYCMPFVSNIL